MLTKLLDPKDEIDQLILSEICNPAIFQLNPLNAIFMGDKQKSENFAKVILSLSESLLKANEHRRKYISFEKQKIEEINDNAKKSSNLSNIGYNPIELTSEVDAFLVQVKSSLDQLARTVKPLFGIQLNGWHKVKNPMTNVQESGFGVLSSLENNISNDKKEKSKKLLELLRLNIPWLTYLVFLRDNPVHNGGTKNITYIIFEQANNKVTPQKIVHGKGNIEDVGIFLTRTINEIIWFTSNFLLISMELAGPGLLLTRTPTGYGWGLPRQTKKKSDPSA